jgi:pyrroline-5-carboxylate reductase
MDYICISGLTNIVKNEPWSSATYDVLNREELMKDRTVGFVGGGRVARIILGGLKRAEGMPKGIVVSDTNQDALENLHVDYPEIKIMPNNNAEAAAQDLVFLGLHPPVLADALAEIKDSLKPEAILISLAPKFSIEKLSQMLGGFNRIVRMIPNAPSIIGQGFNPVAYSKTVNVSDRQALHAYFGALGKCPEVEEDKLEAYAIITAMGPTYLWFQLEELNELAVSFGMTRAEAENGISKMVAGTLNTLFESGLSTAEVMDLIPVKPLGEEESAIRQIYRSKLDPLYKKLKN